MGGGKTPAQPAPPPAPPSTTETSAQAIQAQIDALPKILASQKEFGPQFSELNLEQLEKYGPQFAEAALKLQAEYGPRFAEIERNLSPELAGAQKTLADFLNQTDEQEYQALRPGLLEDVRAAQSVRGLGAISPLGSIDESVQLQRLKQSLKDRRVNVALSTAKRVPIGQMPSVQGTSGTNQLVSNVNPDSIFNYQNSLNNFNSSIFSTSAGIYGNQLSNATARRQQNIGLFSDIAGAGMTLASAGLPMLCWVAAEVFNEPMDGLNVSNARRFILNKAPNWFRECYQRYGKSIARFIHDKPVLKNLIKPLFVWFSKRGAE